MSEPTSPSSSTPFDPSELNLRPTHANKARMYHIPATGSPDKPARSQEVVYDLDETPAPKPATPATPVAASRPEPTTAPFTPAESPRSAPEAAPFDKPVETFFRPTATPAPERTPSVFRVERAPEFTPTAAPRAEPIAEPVARPFAEPVAQGPVAPSPFEADAALAKPKFGGFKPLHGFGRKSAEPKPAAGPVPAQPAAGQPVDEFEGLMNPMDQFKVGFQDLSKAAPAPAVAASAVGSAVDTLIEPEPARAPRSRRGKKGEHTGLIEPPPLALRDVREFVDPSGLPIDELDKLEGIRCHPPRRAVSKYILVLDEFENTPGLLDTFLREHAMSVAGVSIQPVRPTRKNAFLRACEASWVYGPINASRHAVRRLAKRARSKVFEGWLRQTRNPIRPATVCKRYGVKNEAFEDVNAPEFRKMLTDRGVELLICIGCHQRFDEALRSSVPFGAINVHGSLLPHYRGQAPTLHTLADNQRTGGVSVHYATRNLNDGPVLAERAYTVHTHDTLADAYRRSREVAGDALLQAVRKIEHGTLTMAPNPETTARACGKPRRRDVRLVRKGGRKIG